MAEPTRTDPDAGKRFRSPPYPQITLGKAIERVKELHSKAHHNPAGYRVAADAWGYGEKTGALWTTAAALLQYGLLMDEGTGEKRKFQLTDAAVRIVLDPDPTSDKRKAAIKRAALAPKTHAEIWEKFGPADGLSDIMLKTYLTLDRRDEGKSPYSDTAADDVIKIYRDAVQFASLSKSDTLVREGAVKEPPPNSEQKDGDIVPPNPSQAGEQTALGKGERQLTAGLLSKNASFRLVVSGRVGAKELALLIRKLELDKEILADPDADEDAAAPG